MHGPHLVHARRQKLDDGEVFPRSLQGLSCCPVVERSFYLHMCASMAPCSGSHAELAARPERRHAHVLHACVIGAWTVWQAYAAPLHSRASPLPPPRQQGVASWGRASRNMMRAHAAFDGGAGVHVCVGAWACHGLACGGWRTYIRSPRAPALAVQASLRLRGTPAGLSLTWQTPLHATWAPSVLAASMSAESQAKVAGIGMGDSLP